jgi:hypothetical protein
VSDRKLPDDLVEHAPGLPKAGTPEHARAYQWVTVSDAGYPAYTRVETTWEKVQCVEYLHGVAHTVWAWRKVSERKRERGWSL